MTEIKLTSDSFDGSVAVYDLEGKDNKPVHQSTAKIGKHADPVWEVSSFILFVIIFI